MRANNSLTMHANAVVVVYRTTCIQFSDSRRYSRFSRTTWYISDTKASSE